MKKMTTATVMDYRTRDGLADYGFSIEFDSKEGWQVYIVFQPPNQGDEDNSQFPYRATDDDGRPYVNWPTKLDKLGDAKTIAALWAENNERYQYAQQLMRSANGAAKNPSA